jgi:hypothetical protein
LAAERRPEEKSISRPMRVQRVPSLDAMGTLATEWVELEARLSPRTPFTGLLWNQLW